MSESPLRPLIQKVSTGASLSRGEIQTAFEAMVRGEATPAQMGAFLMAMRVRGETIEEITGAAGMLRSHMAPVVVPADAIVGSKVPGAPVWTLNFSLQHTQPLAGTLDLISRLDYEHRDKTYWTLDNLDSQAAYDLLNLSFALEKEHWTARLYVNNLLDEEYIEWFFAARFIGLPADIAWPSQPRQFGLDFSFRY